MREIPLMHRILLRCSAGATRLFRANVGRGWIGNATRITKPGMVMCFPGDVVIREARPFHAGVEGMSDLLGWTTRDGAAIYTALEVKTATGPVRPAQRVFVDQVRAAGGIAGIVRSEDEAVKLIGGSDGRI